MSTLTTPDSIYTHTVSDPNSIAVASAAQATSIQEALNNRQVRTYKWGDASGRTAQADMARGDLGDQADTDTLWRFDGTAWQPLIAPSIVYPAQMQGVSDMGNGTLEGQYLRLGQMVIVEGSLKVGSSTSFNGAEFAVSLPVDQHSKYDVGEFEFIAGNCEFLRPTVWDSSGPVLIRANKPGFAALKMQIVQAQYNMVVNFVVTGSYPIQFAEGDLISWSFTYQAAPSV